MSNTKFDYHEMIKLLLDRAETYSEQTEQILSNFDHVKQAIGNLLNRSPSLITLQDLTPMSDAVVFTAVGRSEVGNTITDSDGIVIEITNENAQEYILKLLIEIPESLLFSDAATIHNYLNTVANKQVFDLDDHGNKKELPQESNQQDEETKPNLNFDMSNLSIDQKIVYNKFIKHYIATGIKH